VPNLLYPDPASGVIGPQPQTLSFTATVGIVGGNGQLQGILGVPVDVSNGPNTTRYTTGAAGSVAFDVSYPPGNVSVTASPDGMSPLSWSGDVFTGACQASGAGSARAVLSGPDNLFQDTNGVLGTATVTGSQGSATAMSTASSATCTVSASGDGFHTVMASAHAAGGRTYVVTTTDPLESAYAGGTLQVSGTTSAAAPDGCVRSDSAYACARSPAGDAAFVFGQAFGVGVVCDAGSTDYIGHPVDGHGGSATVSASYGAVTGLPANASLVECDLSTRWSWRFRVKCR
jgi:hypothetical protein